MCWTEREVQSCFPFNRTCVQWVYTEKYRFPEGQKEIEGKYAPLGSL